MAAITYQDAKELKEGIVRIHKLLELRKLRMNRLRAKQICSVGESVCHDIGVLRQENS